VELDLRFLEDQAAESERLGLEWAEYYQAYKRLLEGQKTFISELKNKAAHEFESKCEIVTEQKLERLALASQEYTAFTELLCEAEKLSIQSKIRYETSKNKFEAKRSWLSLEKSKINLL
jgi:hypothetical protein